MRAIDSKDAVHTESRRSRPPSARTKTPEQLLKETSAWWSTAIIDVQPGQVMVRGYRIEELIGRLPFAPMVWLMLRGEIPCPAWAALLEAALVASVDHGPHAPSIAISRMAVTCGLPMNGAMASAINALDDVHGGAGQQCMELMQRMTAAMADEGLAMATAVERELDRFIAEQGKIVPGFGHRFHGADPRALRLLALLEDAVRDQGVDGRHLRLARAIEAALARRKGVTVPMNVDGATAAIYLELGFAPALARGLFILSRSVGILAHAWEQSEQGGRMKGPMPPSVAYRYTGSPLRQMPTAPRE